MTTTEQREKSKLYMRHWRAGRIVRRMAQPRVLRPNFNRPGYCDNCCHWWPLGGRCPLCCLETGTGQAGRCDFRRWIAWAQLMEAIAS